MAKSKPYVQFSKRIVVAVTVCVTVISIIGLILSYLAGEIDQGTAIIKTYIEYAMVVFAAYSGNSAVEKWLIKRAQNSTDETEEETYG